ncbi:MAG: RloB family protein [Candidatus Methanoplasma sp.]|nr:RloB family protein [Candidatus Methanoplasma sp.]
MVEGKTEALYLRHLKERNSNVEVMVCESENKNPSKMVGNCVHKMKEKGVDVSQGDIAFCVFDVYNNKEDDLRAAAVAAKKSGIKLIVSNPRFEIWLLMHFRSVSGLPADAKIEDMLSVHLGCKYSKTDDIWDHIRGHAYGAAKASKEASDKEGLISPEDFFRCRFSTGMHILTEAVNKLKAENTRKYKSEQEWKRSNR